jgi:hypothetical protein
MMGKSRTSSVWVITLDVLYHRGGDMRNFFLNIETLLFESVWNLQIETAQSKCQQEPDLQKHLSHPMKFGWMIP